MHDPGRSVGSQRAPERYDILSPLDDADTLGDALRIAREQSGLSMAQLSTQTRVHTRFLTALEQGNFAILPSRVFALGYVRAYAQCLGLDEQHAIERFKRETPDPTVPLQAPIGSAFEDVKRHSPRVVAGIVAIVIAVIGWNIFQRVSQTRAAHPSDLASIPEAWSTTSEDMGAVRLGAPLPAPADQTTPTLYITPGLEAQLTGIDPLDPAAIAAAAAAAPPVQAAFNPRGAIYGASATASQVVLQAKKPASLVVRMADGRVLFARQLAAGESWRAPRNVAAVVDVSDITAFDIYLNGEHGGTLAATVTPLAQLNTRAQALAAQSAAAVEAERQVALRAQAAAAAAIAAANPLPATSVPTGG